MTKRPIASTIDYSFEHKPYDNTDTMAFHHPFRNHIVIYLELIESMEDLYLTIEHEALHECFFSEDLDGDIEHKMISAIQWANSDVYNPVD